jgi:hypothetical protein
MCGFFVPKIIGSSREFLSPPALPLCIFAELAIINACAVVTNRGTHVGLERSAES